MSLINFTHQADFKGQVVELFKVMRLHVDTQTQV